MENNATRAYDSARRIFDAVYSEILNFETRFRHEFNLAGEIAHSVMRAYEKEFGVHLNDDGSRYRIWANHSALYTPDMRIVHEEGE